MECFSKHFARGSQVLIFWRNQSSRSQSSTIITSPRFTPQVPHHQHHPFFRNFFGAEALFVRVRRPASWTGLTQAQRCTNSGFLVQFSWNFSAHGGQGYGTHRGQLFFHRCLQNFADFHRFGFTDFHSFSQIFTDFHGVPPSCSHAALNKALPHQS